MFHIVYRWIIAGYFFGWLVTSGVTFSESGPRWLIYLTNWAIVGFVLYLIVAALSVTTKFLTVHVCKKNQSNNSDHITDYEFDSGCCRSHSNQLSWYQMFHWATFALFAEMAPAIVILFWTAVYTNGPVDGINANTHAVNGIVLILDVLFFGIPVALVQMIYPMLFGIAYGTFTGIFWTANGTNPVNEERYIYPVLDYGLQPTTATIVVVLVALLFIPLVHIVLFAIYLARFWLVYVIYSHNRISCYGEKQEERQMEEQNMHGVTV